MAVGKPNRPSCGVERSRPEGRFYALKESGEKVPFNKGTFERHIEAAKGSTFTLDTVENLLEVMRVAIDVASAETDNNCGHLRIHLICAHLINYLAGFLRDFDLAAGVKKRVPVLAKSPDKRQRNLGSWICSLTGSRALMTARYG
jgi:hypothetical protein